MTPRRTELHLLPGVRELLETARARGVRIALGTGNRRDVLLPRLERLGIAECLVLEDSVPGCDAEVAAGMQVVACPSVVTAHCTFPAEARRVASLLELLSDEGGI